VSEKAEGEIFNIGSEETVSIKELAGKIKKAARSSSEIKFVPYKDAFSGKSADFEDMHCRIPDITKLKKAIGYRPEYALDMIIKDVLDYYSGEKNP
jgi:UDP-glucose 4-epimerase